MEIKTPIEQAKVRSKGYWEELILGETHKPEQDFRQRCIKCGEPSSNLLVHECEYDSKG